MCVPFLFSIGIDLLVTVKNKDTDKIDDKEYDELNNDLSETFVENNSDSVDKSTVNDDVEMEPEQEQDQDQDHGQCASDTRTATTSTEDNIEEDDDDSSSEHELTNLGWLIDLKNLAQWPVDSNVSNRKNQHGNTHSTLVNGISNCIMNDIDDDETANAPVISEKDLSEERFKKFTVQVKQ